MKTSVRIRAIIVLILGLIAISIGMKAQNNVIRKGNQFEQVDSQKSRKTEFTYKTRDGKVYPIFLSPKGKAYINRISKNGKEYKQYLPKITEMLKMTQMENLSDYAGFDNLDSIYNEKSKNNNDSRLQRSRVRK